MASYSQVYDPVVDSIDHMCHDGVGNLYFLARHAAGVAYRVHRYNIDGAVDTDISGATFNGFAGLGKGTQLEWFDGGLYIIMTPSVGNVGVYKWDGPGTQTWTLVDGLFTGFDNTNGYNWICADNDRIVWIHDPFGGTRRFRMSTDGSAWANQSGVLGAAERVDYDRYLGELVVEEVAAAPGNAYRLTYAGANSWSSIGATSYQYHWIGSCAGYQSFDDSTQPVGLALQRSTNWVTMTHIAPDLWYDHSYMQVCYLQNQGILVDPDDASPGRIYFFNTGTESWDLDGTLAGGVGGGADSAVYNNILYILNANTGTILKRDTNLPSVKTDYSPSSAWRPCSMDVGADDYYLHIAAIRGGTPVLMRLLADLSGLTIETYTPGAGTAIGVQCGDEDENWVWIAGDFGATKVRVSLNDGGAWTTKDPGGWNGVALPLVVGPYWDNLVLVPTDGDDDLFETETGGLSWAVLNAALPFDVGAMDRLDINLDEIVIGSDVDRNLRYSPNNGASLHDISGAAMSNVAINDIIVG